jgi:hypothetical protein
MKIEITFKDECRKPEVKELPGSVKREDIERANKRANGDETACFSRTTLSGPCVGCSLGSCDLTLGHCLSIEIKSLKILDEPTTVSGDIVNDLEKGVKLLTGGIISFIQCMETFNDIIKDLPARKEPPQKTKKLYWFASVDHPCKGLRISSYLYDYRDHKGIVDMRHRKGFQIHSIEIEEEQG